MPSSELIKKSASRTHSPGLHIILPVPVSDSSMYTGQLYYLLYGIVSASKWGLGYINYLKRKSYNYLIFSVSKQVN